MLIAKWRCASCGWEGDTADLINDKEGHKVCPRCKERKGLE